MDAKKGKTRKESTPIKVWVTPQEKAAIAAKADTHSLSASSYLRRLGLAMPSSIDDRSVGYSGPGEDQHRPRMVRRTDQNVVNHERRF
jgi:hypothetical protein